jgi:hypothetical protein
MIRALAALAIVAGLASPAQAIVCARGEYHAGCAGPRGAVGVHRPYGYGGAAVARPYGVRCFYRAGVRVCR